MANEQPPIFPSPSSSRRTPPPTTPLKVEPPSPPPIPDPPRTAPIIEGFVRAIRSIQGSIPAAWSDPEGVAGELASRIPRLTVARLLVWCRENHQSVEIVAAKVLTDALATEPGLMELTPAEAAEEGAALIQSLWPKGALTQRQPPPPPQSKPLSHPVLDTLRSLGETWHRLSILPPNQAKAEGPTAWRQRVLGDISRAKMEGLRAGLTRDQMLAALESSGDRWVWEIPPPARDYALDEFGMPPPGAELFVAPSMPPA